MPHLDLIAKPAERPIRKAGFLLVCSGRNGLVCLGSHPDTAILQGGTMLVAFLLLGSLFMTGGVATAPPVVPCHVASVGSQHWSRPGALEGDWRLPNAERLTIKGERYEHRTYGTDTGTWWFYAPDRVSGVIVLFEDDRPTAECIPARVSGRRVEILGLVLRR